MTDYLNRNLPTEPRTRVADGAKEKFENDSLFSLAGRERKYSRQFFSMYQARLNELKTRVDKEASEKWGNGTRRADGQTIQHKPKILDIVSGELCWVSGTVFSEMKYKLNILADVEKGTDDVMPKAPSSYVGEDQAVMMLEDESGRAILHNEALLTRSGLVTGCVVAILGIEIQAGIFEAMEVMCPTLAPQKPLPEPKSDSEYIAIVSGLHFTSKAECDLRSALLSQWLTGELGCGQDADVAGRISRLVIAGNSVGELEEEEKPEDQMFGSKNKSHFKTESLELFASWLREVMASVPVTVMPGAEDPAEVCVPQHPVHKSLFGVNSQYVGSTPESPIQTISNPAWLECGNGLRIVGTSGQNILDIHKYYAQEADPVETMLKTLHWQHIAPTAPDTLYCYPYEDEDPFVLGETPHVYFAGNQSRFGVGTLEEKNATVISVPRFDLTGQIVLLNTATREVKAVSFDIN